MKKILINTGLFALMVLTMASCDWIDPDINVDPDSPADAPMQFALPAAQTHLGFNLHGNDLVRTTHIWMQLWDGESRQSLTEARYQLTPADINNFWNTIYYDMMMNFKVLIDKSSQEGFESPHFRGVARVCMAVTLGVATDHFGDIPYSNAFAGEDGVLKATFDTQEQIYVAMQQLLSDAIADLGTTDLENAKPLTGDILYGNDPAMWMRAAYALKARYALNLSEVNGNAAATEALGYLGNAFTGTGDDLEFPFSATHKNPHYAFGDERGDVWMGSTFMDLLNATGDPRTAFYATNEGDGLIGSIPGSEGAGQGAISRPGDYVAAIDAPVYFMGYAEQKFIEAEANLMLGNAGPALTAWQEGVAASVFKVTGATNQAWLDANINNVLSVTLEDIIEQKYMANYGTAQPYNDYRRTGFPVLSLAQSARLNQIPTRFPYAQDELDYNAENTPSVVITDKVWWDK